MCVCVCVCVYVGGAGVRGVMVTVVENEHGDRSSNPGQYCLHFIYPLGFDSYLSQDMNRIILSRAMSK